MKRAFILVFVSIISIGYSQTQTIAPGIYKSDVKGQKLILRIGEDNQFEMAILYGKYTVENDTISFKNPGSNESGFKIKANADAPFSSTLKVKFSSQYTMYLDNVYIGT